MSRASRLAVTFLVLLAGCDGHLRLLHLRPPGAEAPPWNIARVVIDIDGDEDVVGIVSRVADELGLARDPAAPHVWSVREPKRNNTFTMGLMRKDGGCWEVSLSDWPNAARSGYSVRAERRIREAVRRDAGGDETKGAAGGHAAARGDSPWGVRWAPDWRGVRVVGRWRCGRLSGPPLVASSNRPRSV